MGEGAGCRLLIVFGSAAQDRAGANSDIDIAVAFDPLPDPPRRL
ncbi:MAG: nucleotidyltransferase family protein [Longimicrobiales bacterium]